MKTVDVILLGLTALALGAGAGLVYRAHHQGDVRIPPVFTESAVSDEKQPVQSPVPGAVVPASVRQLPVVYGATVGKTWCRDGLLYWETPNGPGPVYVNGRYSRCEIQAEPVRPQNSEATD